MARIALTGGIASGKSFVADQLREHGAIIIDSDVLAREVVEPGTPGLAAIVERFGPEILTKKGTLDRPKLGSIIFSDDDARADLNAIVHPLVRERSMELEAEAPEGAIVVHVIPLLVETGLDKNFEEIIVVDVPRKVQVKRLMHRNDLSMEEARKRVRAQATRVERRAVATHVIDNDQDPASTVRQVEKLWAKLSG
ncbi:MAG: dephospho-CoA kinase [Propionibacteriaceae bacterium]|nr:dephospho-CoA kinase [Propionibacteriaceae bacterium]